MVIKGKDILITGGLGELGKPIVKALEEKGANVYIFDLSTSGKSNCFKVDIANEYEVEKILQQIDNVDVLINCVGEIYSEPIVNVLQQKRHKREDWDRIIRNNLTSCFNMSTLVAEKMIKKRIKGVIINFSSISSHGNAGQAAYSTAKAGVEAFTNVLAKEVGMFKIRACTIAPGFIDTPSTRKALSERLLEYWVKQTPLRKLGEVEDVVSTVEYVISCDYLSGCTVSINGGMTI